MKTEKEVLRKFAAKSLGLTDAEVDALLYKKADDSDEMVLVDNAADSLLTKNKDKIDIIKKEKGEAFDNGHKKGLGESLSSYETKVKEELGIKTDKTGVDLIRHYGETQKESGDSDPTEDQVKKHPTFIKLEQDSKKSTEDAVKVVQDEFNLFKGTTQKKEMSTERNSDAMKIVTPLNPVIEGDVGENQRKNFLESLNLYNYEKSNGTYLITDPNNNDARLEDPQGNAINFDNFIESNAKKFFVFAEQDPLHGPNNNNDNKWDDKSVLKITNEEDIKTLMREAAGDSKKEAKISIAATAFRAKK